MLRASDRQQLCLFIHKNSALSTAAPRLVCPSRSDPGSIARTARLRRQESWTFSWRPRPGAVAARDAPGLTLCRVLTRLFDEPRTSRMGRTFCPFGRHDRLGAAGGQGALVGFSSAALLASGRALSRRAPQCKIPPRAGVFLSEALPQSATCAPGGLCRPRDSGAAPRRRLRAGARHGVGRSV